MAEWKITAGIWAVGFMVLTIAIKVALTVLTGEMSVEPRSGATRADEHAPPLAQ
jgi:molybdopterin-containing oxidoreductase family membrane subunit